MDNFITQNIVSIFELLVMILVYVISYALTWQKIIDRIGTLEKRMNDHKKIHEDLDKKIDGVNDISVKLARIEVDIAWIKQKLIEK